MQLLVFIALINFAFVTCHQINKREIDEEGYDWDAGVPHYEHFHYNEDGEIDFAPRIIGGNIAAAGEFPAKISVQTTAGNHFCGGALIDLRHVLTAAHCLVTDFGAVVSPNGIRLMGDDTSIQRWGSGSRQIRFPSHLFVHPAFSLRTYSSDIAVIRTSSPFTRTQTLNFLPRVFFTPSDDEFCNLAGWGVTAETNQRPHPILLRIDIKIISTEFCNSTQSYQGLIPQGHLCAGRFDGSRDACFGDSGGGLICGGRIAGVVSFGFGCGRQNFPGAYVDVAQFNQWIQECMASTVPHDEIPRPTPLPNGSVAKLLSTLALAVWILFQIVI